MWSKGDVSLSETLTDSDHLYPEHINELREAIDSLVINVKDYGAVGDGTTDDTASINAALAVANVIVGDSGIHTLFFPAGKYMVTPGSLVPITCHFDASEAKICANTNGNGAMITIGTSASNPNSHYNIKISELSGFNWVGSVDAFTGTGITFSNCNLSSAYCDKNNIYIGELVGFYVGLKMNGKSAAPDDFHIGLNNIHINTLGACHFGIYIDTGDLPVEANEIFINYITQCLGYILMNSTGTAKCIQNNIRVECLEAGYFTGTEIITASGSNTIQNMVKVDSLFIANETFVNHIIVGDGSSSGNVFRVAGIDLSKLVAAGDDIYINDGIGLLGETTSSRSVIWGPSPAPTSGKWKIGDRYIVNNPTPGNIASYCYTASGWKAETTLA